MADISAIIETLEHRFMRAWMRREKGEMRKFAARDFTMIIGTQRPQLLDKPSFLEASDKAFSCNGFRFREVYVRKHKGCAWFAAGVDLELQIDGKDWSGHFWMTDLWRKSAIKRSWQLVERSLSLTEDDHALSQSIKRLQLWR
jgi:hypothetical protein